MSDFMKNNLMMDNPPPEGSNPVTRTTETTVYAGEEGQKMFDDLSEQIRNSILDSLGKLADMPLKDIVEKATWVRGAKTEKGTDIEFEYKRFKFKVKIKDKKEKKKDKEKK